MGRKRPHKHEVLTKALAAAKTKAQSGSFVYLVRLAYSLAFNGFNPPVVLVVPYVSPSETETADALAEALTAPKGTWCWDDLEPVNYEFGRGELQSLSLELSEAARNEKVAFCGFKPAKS